VTVSYSTYSEWTLALTTADSLLTELRSKLLSSQADYEALKVTLSKADETLKQLETSVTLWQHSSSTWETSSVNSAQLLATLQTSLAEAKRKYDALSTAWSSFKAQNEAVLSRRESEVRVWRSIAIVAGVLAVALGGIAIVTNL